MLPGLNDQIAAVKEIEAAGDGAGGAPGQARRVGWSRRSETWKPCLQRSKPTGDFDVVEVAQVVANADVVENAAEAAQGDAHSIRSAEAAELAAPFDVRLQIEEHAGDATLAAFRSWE